MTKDLYYRSMKITDIQRKNFVQVFYDYMGWRNGVMSLTPERKGSLRKKFKVFSAIFKMLIFLVILVGIPLYIYFFHHILLLLSSFHNQMST